MKKALKTITSAILIAIIALSSTAAAFATGGSIEWVDTEDDMSVPFAYGGKDLELGTATIKNTNPGESLVYFGFEAENSGYYTIDTEKDSWIKVPEYVSDGKAYDYLYWETINEDEERLYYIEKGETVIGFNFYEESTDTVEIEYLGEEIVDFTVDEKALEDLILGWDINKYDAGSFWIESDTVITFSNGKTLSIEDFVFECVNKKYPVEGENQATVLLFDESKKMTYTLLMMESIVESVEMTNMEDYLTAKIDYNGYLYTDDVNGETLTVNFKDGTKWVSEISFNFAEVTLPNGRTVEAYVGEYWNEGDEVYFVIELANTEFERKEFEIGNKTLAENFEILYEDNENMLYWAKSDFISGIKNLFSNPEWSVEFFGYSISEFFQIFRNMFSFMRFYLSIA